MDVQIGSAMSLKFSDDQQEIEGLFVGSEAHDYMIVRLPLGIDRTALEKGRPLSVSYESSGNAFHIESSILYYLEKFQLIFLSYPQAYEISTLRKEDRINCHIPATVSIDRKALKGLITDISNNGCQFIVKIPSTFKLHRVSVLTDINLALSSFGQSDPTQFKGKVRNTNIDEYKIVLGIEFDQLEEHSSRRLKGFIEKMKVLQ